MSQHRESNFTAGLVVGTFVGAGLALLFAPQAGAETRGQIRRLGRKTIDDVAEASSRLRSQGEALVEKGRDVAAKTVQRGREVLAETADEVATMTEQVRGAGNGAADTGRLG